MAIANNTEFVEALAAKHSNYLNEGLHCFSLQRLIEFADEYAKAASSQMNEALTAVVHATVKRDLRGYKHVPSMREQQAALAMASKVLAAEHSSQLVGSE